MKPDNLNKVIEAIDDSFIDEASSYSPPEKKAANLKSLFIKAPVAATVIILLLIGAIAYTTANMTGWSSSIRFEDGSEAEIIDSALFKNIPDTAPKTKEGENMLPMTHAEVEANLGFDILCYENAHSKTVNYSTLQNKDGRIARVSLWWPEILVEGEANEKMLSQSVYMLNTGADQGYIAAFKEGVDAMGHKKLLDEIFIVELGINAVCYTASDMPEIITVTFVHDSIMYSFTGHGYTLEEIISVLKQLR